MKEKIIDSVLKEAEIKIIIAKKVKFPKLKTNESFSLEPLYERMKGKGLPPKDMDTYISKWLNEGSGKDMEFYGEPIVISIEQGMNNLYTFKHTNFYGQYKIYVISNGRKDRI